MGDDLVKRLKDRSQFLWTTERQLQDNKLAKAAADRIEELEANLAAAYRKGQVDMQERAASVAFHAEAWRVDASIRALQIKEKGDE